MTLNDYRPLLCLCLFAITSVQPSLAQKENTAVEQAPTDTVAKTETTETPPTKANAPIERTLPNLAENRQKQLHNQYPAEDIQNLNASGQTFIALWNKDQSGDAYGAVLLLHADGQTANWPNIIEPLRTELPQNGWSTLSIDLQPIRIKQPPAKLEAAKSDNKDALESESIPFTDTENLARIDAAIQFLNQEGQFNIVMAGYGNSAHRLLDYLKKSDGKAAKTTQQGKLNRPIRAVILINPSDYQLGPSSPLINDFPYPDMPLLDIVVGNHYLHKIDADKRKAAAGKQRIKTYIQLTLMPPRTEVFDDENRLTRRMRGFLNRYAKGVEVGRR